MRFKSQEREKIEEINLVPMMDVLMSILTFFILLSMILTGALEGVDVKLPSEQSSAEKTDSPPPLRIEINDNNEILVAEKSVSQEQLLAEIQAHLDRNPQNTAVLVAAPKANYEKVVQLLAAMRKTGSDRVSLGIESAPPTAE